MPKQSHYFRNKNLVPRRPWYQKILRPLAVWIAARSPLEYLKRGLTIAVCWWVLVWLVVTFYTFVTVLPWLIVGIAITLGGISIALNKDTDK